jgi:LPS sulfotransferase NodH
VSYTRFVIISHLRSGTHLLRTLLESHPGIVCQTEVFNSDNPNLPYPLSASVDEILAQWVFRDLPANTECAGFVLQAYHPGGLRAFPGIRENPNWAEIWTRLQQMVDLRVIHLRRRNGLLRHLSHVLARQTGAWHDWDPARVHKVTHIEKPLDRPSPAETRPTVRLDAARLEIDFREVDRLHQRVEHRFGSGHYFPIVYEELIADPEGRSAELLNFLGVAPLELKPAVRKIEKRPLVASIENFEELKREFSGTPWQSFFDEGPAG